jgi:hypothetical protein
MSNQEHFSHLLQKKGLLKNFSIAKIFPTEEIDKLKEKIRADTKSDAEFTQVFDEEMRKIGNMHDLANPIPGIIYDTTKKNLKISKLIEEHSKKLKAHDLTKTELCYYISSLVKAVGLTQEDFDVADGIDSPIDDDDDDDDGPYRDSDYNPNGSHGL